MWHPVKLHSGIRHILLIFYLSPHLCSNQDSRIIHWHARGTRGPIGVIGSPIICYEAGDSACFFRFADLDLIIVVPSLARILKVNFASGEEISISNCINSCSVFGVNLGLHPYLQDGGWSRLGIKVEFHEGAVPFSALHAFYWQHLVLFVLSVSYISYLFMFIFS